MSQETKSFNNVETDAFSVIPYLENCLRANIVPILIGKPGVGKSAAIHHGIAKANNLKMIDIRLAQLDPTDLNGFPAPDLVNGRARYLIPEIFPMEDDPIPDGYEGWLLFLDELTNAPNTVQGAAFKLILDRKIGQKNLHPNCFIICAGNRATDRAAAGKLNTAMQSRLAHFDIASNFQKWTEWAMSKNFDYRITAFINYKPELLNNFKPDNSDRTFACERTWETVNKYIDSCTPMGAKSHHTDLPHKEFYLPLSGIIGKGPAIEFIEFADIYKDLPDLNTIAANPSTHLIPDRPDIMYAMTGAISEKLTPANLDNWIIYIERLGIEFQILIIRGACNRDNDLNGHPALIKWAMRHASRLNFLNK